MLVNLENGRGIAHVDANKITMAWKQGNRYALKFGKDDVIHVDEESFEKVVEWIDWEEAIQYEHSDALDILTDKLRNVKGLHEFAELFGFNWDDESDWTWHDVAVAMADRIDGLKSA